MFHRLKTDKFEFTDVLYGEKRMKEFILEEYYKNYQKKTYLDVFFDFVLDKFESEKIEGQYFALLNENDLLESLNYFITVRKVTAKQTASAFWGKLKKLYENLEKYYGIANDFYVNGNFLPELEERARNRYSVLNDTIDKSIATDDQYDILVNEIKEFEQKYSYEEAVEGIEKYLQENNLKSEELRMFRLICSICATQMVLEYGFKNNIVRDIKLSDIDLERGIIKRNGYTFPLSAMLKRNLDRYLEIRKYILIRTKKEQEWLFINFDGEPFHTQDYAAKLFYILSVLYEGVETDPFARRCLIEMIEKGFNAELISELTGYKDTVYKNVCSIVNSNKEYVEKKLADFINEVDNHKTKIMRKGYIYCPICGKPVKAVSDELVLIKKRDDDFLYLACKKCGGYNG